MLAYNHLLFGVTAWLGVEAAGYSTPLPLPMELALVCFGSLLPDIDHPGSTFGRRLLWLSWPIRIFFGHRGITHSLLAVAAAGWVVAALPGFAACIALGYLSHLAADYLTGGVPLLWPMPRQYRFPLAFETGGIIEHVVVFSLLGSLLAWLLNSGGVSG